MGMDQVGVEIPDSLFQFRDLPEISRDPFPLHTEIPALDALFFNFVHLLGDKRSITAFLVAGDD